MIRAFTTVSWDHFRLELEDIQSKISGVRFVPWEQPNQVDGTIVEIDLDHKQLMSLKLMQNEDPMYLFFRRLSSVSENFHINWNSRIVNIDLGIESHARDLH